MCLFWFGTVLLFFIVYPLKAWNYILPLVPVASILGARVITYLMTTREPLFSGGTRKWNLVARKALVSLAGILILGTATVTQAYAVVHNLVYDRPFVGLREAALWLKENTQPGAGVMTISQGSAQYVLSLYTNIDSYPYGNFRLHTILPGGTMVPGAPLPDPLIQDGTVTYLVHYTSTGGDDPVHMPNKAPKEKKFMEFINKYDSEIRFVFYDTYTDITGNEVVEARLWIYEVGKRLPEPELNVAFDGELLNLTGRGFLIDEFVTVHYGNSLIEKIPTDDAGFFSYSFTPAEIIPGAQLVVFDEAGNRRTALGEKSIYMDKIEERTEP